MNTNLALLYLIILLSCNIFVKGFAQEQDPLQNSNDPIRESIAQKDHKFEGIKLTEKEFNYLTRINEKYRLSGKEKQLRRSYKDTLNLIERYRLARTYRKEYVHTKKILKFRKKKIESMQTKEALKRMKESEKRAKARYRRKKWEARKRKFLNLFK